MFTKRNILWSPDEPAGGATTDPPADQPVTANEAKTAVVEQTVTKTELDELYGTLSPTEKEQLLELARFGLSVRQQEASKKIEPKPEPKQEPKTEPQGDPLVREAVERLRRLEEKQAEKERKEAEAAAAAEQKRKQDQERAWVAKQLDAVLDEFADMDDKDRRHLKTKFPGYFAENPSRDISGTFRKMIKEDGEWIETRTKKKHAGYVAKKVADAAATRGEAGSAGAPGKQEYTPKESDLDDGTLAAQVKKKYGV